jgi:transmembrane sensor
MSEETYYKELVERYVAKKASDEELEVFFKLAGEGKLDNYLEEKFVEGNLPLTADETLPARRIPTRNRIAIAATVILLLAVGAFVILNKSPAISEKETTQVAAASPSPYNAVTPRGGQKQMTLPDGTRIWLNAASSIQYPKSFTGSERTIALDGECYFEVAHNSSQPFRVNLNNGVTIEVTGTQFNVYAYSTEGVKATLVEGAIKIQSKDKSVILQPGQEVEIQKGGQMTVSRADIQEALAWKNGILQFNGADVPTVMRRIERWFDVDVVYAGKIPQRRLAGKIRGNTNINEVLKILELSNVHCKVDGRKITVLPDEKK